MSVAPASSHRHLWALKALASLPDAWLVLIPILTPIITCIDSLYDRLWVTVMVALIIPSLIRRWFVHNEALRIVAMLTRRYRLLCALVILTLCAYRTDAQDPEVSPTGMPVSGFPLLKVPMMLYFRSMLLMPFCSPTRVNGRMSMRACGA